MPRSRPHSCDDDHTPRIGQVIEVKPIGALTPTEVVARHTMDERYKSIHEQTFGARIFIDVHDTSILKLRLPDRSAVIEDAGLDNIKKMARELYIRALAGEGCIDDKTWGRANGIPLSHSIRTDAEDPWSRAQDPEAQYRDRKPAGRPVTKAVTNSTTPG